MSTQHFNGVIGFIKVVGIKKHAGKNISIDQPDNKNLESFSLFVMDD